MIRVAILVFSLLILSAVEGSAQQNYPAGLGWSAVSGTSWRSLCPSGVNTDAGDDCSGIMRAWGAGLYDKARKRFCMWGGGHGDYWGNQMYCFSVVSKTWSMLYTRSTSPVLFFGGPNVGTMADGKIGPRHTYNHFVSLPTQDKYFYFGGAQSVQGSFINDTWFFDPVTNTWAEKNVTGNIPNADFGMNAQYNPNDDRVYIQDSNNLYQFNPATLNYVIAKNQSQGCGYRSGFLDTKRNFYYTISGQSDCGTAGLMRRISLTGTISANSWQTVSTSGSNSFLASNNFCAAIYDPVIDRAVFHCGGQTVYTMDVTTGVITANNLGVTPPSLDPRNQCSGGQCILTKLQYAPSEGVYILPGLPDNNVHVLRLTAEANNDWYNRSHGPGVQYFNGFDSAAEIGSTQVSRPNTGLFCGASCATLDTTTFASGSAAGNGSLLMTVQSGVGAENPSGSFEIDLRSNPFLPGQTIYTQYQLMIDFDSLTQLQQSSGQGGWKTSITANYAGGSCQQMEITQNNNSWNGIPSIYTTCGGVDWSFTEPGVDTILQYTGPYPPSNQSWPVFCRYNNSDPLLLPNHKCKRYTTNQWMTFNQEYSLGTLGQPNSRLKLQIAYPGDTQWTTYFDRSDVIVQPGGSNNIDWFQITNYMTGRCNPGTCTHTPSTVRFRWDGLIVSRQPIALPGAPAAASGPQTFLQSLSDSLGITESPSRFIPRGKMQPAIQRKLF